MTIGTIEDNDYHLVHDPATLVEHDQYVYTKPPMASPMPARSHVSPGTSIPGVFLSPSPHIKWGKFVAALADGAPSSYAMSLPPAGVTPG